tara:strand:- start:2195 stop:2692 length:498 start_codon:yes stop_codon:yes gene_type:complete
MILESNLKNKFVAFLLLFCYPAVSFADPEVNSELIPPGEAMYVTDLDILNKLNLGPDSEPVWCYSNLANSLIITSADREREKCELKSNQEIEKITLGYNFELEQLNIQLRSLNAKHDEIIELKNRQIKELTQAALARPNDYSIWWATGGVVVGILSTLAITLAVK